MLLVAVLYLFRFLFIRTEAGILTLNFNINCISLCNSVLKPIIMKYNWARLCPDDNCTSIISSRFLIKQKSKLVVKTKELKKPFELHNPHPLCALREDIILSSY